MKKNKTSKVKEVQELPEIVDLNDMKGIKYKYTFEVDETKVQTKSKVKKKKVKKKKVNYHLVHTRVYKYEQKDLLSAIKRVEKLNQICNNEVIPAIEKYNEKLDSNSKADVKKSLNHLIKESLEVTNQLIQLRGVCEYILYKLDKHIRIKKEEE